LALLKLIDSKAKPKNLYIIGTSHHYQFGAGAGFGDEYCSRTDENAFIEMLSNVVRKTNSNAIAEELNPQAVIDIPSSTPIIKNLTKQLGISHSYCDPDRNQRFELEIKDENEIRISLDLLSGHDTKIQELVNESYQRREDEWLKRLCKISASDIIFVCGANHINTFTPKAIKAGFLAKVVYDCWQAPSVN
jgi:hypothetical protein